MNRMLFFTSLWIISAATPLPFLFPWAKLPSLNLPSFLMPFFKPREPELTNFCIYSADPSKFTPKCILCPDSAYPSIIEACIGASSVPVNVTFTQAYCIEQNCKLHHPQQTNRNIFDFRKTKSTEDEPSTSGQNLEVASGVPLNSALETLVLSPSSGDSINSTLSQDADNAVEIEGRQYRITSNHSVLASEEEDV